jgi:hypothetical protein
MEKEGTIGTEGGVGGRLYRRQRRAAGGCGGWGELVGGETLAARIPILGETGLGVGEAVIAI